MRNDEIRSRMRALRRALPDEAQREASQAICARIAGLPEYGKAGRVMAYAAVRGEADLSPVIADILSSGRTLLLPRCGDAGGMTARQVEDLSQLYPGAFGIREPGEDCRVCPPEEIDLILVPGTAFDRRGNRIGQGGGYYDRFLPQTLAVRLGVCHDFALLERIEAGPLDVPVDLIVTPSGVWRFD